MKKDMFLAILPVFFYLFLLPDFSSAQEKDTTTEKKYFELSFGQSLLFISYTKTQQIIDQEAVVIPTSSMLFFAEMRPLKKIRIPFFFNLPTETKQFLIDSVLVNERAAPTFGTGVEFNLLNIPIGKKSVLEFEMGPLASFLMSGEDRLRFVPIGACRARIVKEKNFVMYMGSSYSFGINVWGMFYGTGFIF